MCDSQLNQVFFLSLLPVMFSLALIGGEQLIDRQLYTFIAPSNVFIRLICSMQFAQTLVLGGL